MATLPTRPKQLLATAALVALGVAGNLLGVELGYAVTFLFGSIFSLIALCMLEAPLGVAVTALVASTTWALWNHPYAIVILVGEALWILAARKRGERPLALVVSAYWLIVGAPLVGLFYHGAMGLGAAETALVALKQGLNSVSNALVASALVELLPLHRWLGVTDTRRGTPIAHVLFQFIATVLIVPSLVVVLLDNHREGAERQAEAVDAVATETREVGDLVEAWAKQHVAAAAAVADAGRRAEFAPSASLQAELARLRALFPDFHNVYVADVAARTAGFDPPRNARGESTIGLDFSDRAYVGELRRTRAPVVSEIFMGRGGVFAPIFSVSVPVLEQGRLVGFGLGAVNLERLQAHLARRGHDRGCTATLVDARGHIIASASPEYRPLEALPDHSPQRELGAGSGVGLYVPGLAKRTSNMAAWSGALLVARAPLAGTPWTLHVERPIAPLQHELYASTSRSLVIVTVLYGLALVVAGAVSRGLASTPRALAAISRDLPARIEDGVEPAWPTSRIAEMSTLVANFKATADALRERVTAIKASNVELEDRVLDRTRELFDKTVELRGLTAGLEKRIAEEVVLRRRNEQMLAQQSKLAAMGEMVGAIAHQWRQPLNALALIVQNLRDELDDEPSSVHARVDEMVERAMAQIRQMSKTIEDFRGFFAPDRAETTFDAADAASAVVKLVSAQLASQAIACGVERIDDGAGPPLVCARRSELEHVVHNLLNNARDAIVERRGHGGGGGVIRITVRGEAERVLVEVRDDGGGVDPSMVDRIFEPYFTTKPVNGTGIGLYVSKLILEDHCRARLSVRNEGEGAVFTIDLPRAAG